MVVTALGCQRRREPVTAVSLPSGFRFDVPVRARPVLAARTEDREFSLPGGSVFAVTEEAMAEDCQRHIAWAIEEARNRVKAGNRMSAARGPERLTVAGRDAVRIGLVIRGTDLQRVDMIGVCAGGSFVIFQVAQRGQQLDAQYERTLFDAASSLRR
jgi:hypothetical protein